jgi:biotin operon repressor
MKTSESLFEEMYSSKTVPDFRTLVYYLNRNPETCAQTEKILFEMSIRFLKKRIKELKLKRITIDLDQTARAIHGRQQGAKKGYSAKDRNSKLFQVAVWTVRETKTVFKLEFLSGEKHSGNDLLNRMEKVMESLKELGVEITVVCDSGYENTEVFEYLDLNKIQFLIAIKQFERVKTRGKYAKKKTMKKKKGEIATILKERKLETKSNFQFREIFVQNKIACDEFGQLFFEDFDSNEFTNVFVTNMNLTASNVYEFYKKHAQVETIIEELKNDFHLAISHNHKFEFNHAMSQIAAIAYNVKNMFVSDKKILQTKNEIIKLSTLQRKLIHIPGLIVNNGGKIILKVEKRLFEHVKIYFSLFNYNLANP